MKTKSNAYYRARLIAIRDMAANARDENKRWYQNGFIPEFDREGVDNYIANRIDAQSNEPLSFTELTTYGTWFEMHPEKVAGKMQRGTSLYFPLIVKGTRADVENLIKSALATEQPAPKPAPAAQSTADAQLKLLEKHFGKGKVRKTPNCTDGKPLIESFSRGAITHYSDVRFEVKYPGSGWDFCGVCLVFPDRVEPECDVLPEYKEFISKQKPISETLTPEQWHAIERWVWSGVDEKQAIEWARIKHPELWPEPTDSNEDEEMEMLELEAEALKLKLNLLKL